MKLRLITLVIYICFLFNGSLCQKENYCTGQRPTTMGWNCVTALQLGAWKHEQGRTSKNMQLELSPPLGTDVINVAHMETFGRLMAGISPWLALPDDDTEEGKMRKQMREWAVLAYKMP